MDLTHGERLWWLAALPVLWLLARPLRPKAIVATPYLALWKRAQERLGRRPLRVRWWRLLLLAAAFASAALAFAGARAGHRGGPTALAVLLDDSASMAARVRPGAASAFEQAKAALSELLARLPPEVAVTVATLSGRTWSLLPGERRELARFEEFAPAVGATARGLDALAARVATPECATWVLTDALVPVAAPAAGALSLFGAPCDNLAITAAHVVDAWPLPEVRVEIEVQNASRRSVVATLAAIGGATGATVDLEVAAGASRTTTLVLRRTTGGRIRVALSAGGDALASDDAIELVVPGPAATDLAVLVDQDDNPALRAAAQALAAECGGHVVAAGASERAGMLLVDGGALAPAVLGPRRITFGTRFSSAALQPGALLARPTLVDWDRGSPLLAGLDLSELQVTRALGGDFGGPGQVLVRGADGPLAVVREWPDGRSVHFAFSLTESNLALLPAFPSLLRRAYAACYRDQAIASILPGVILDAAESDLRTRPAGLVERPLPEFGSPGTSLVVPLLLAALALLVARIYS